MEGFIDDFKLETAFHEDYTEHEVDGQREKWRRQKCLGEGGFGVVWLEKEESTQRYRAVKTIQHTSRIDYRKELLALEKFSRPKYRQFFVQFHGWFEYAGHGQSCIMLAMKYVPHGDLHTCVHSTGPLGEDVTMIISKQLASGLKMLHEAGFTHRDLKLPNIFVESKAPDWVVKIGDFGLAKQIRNNDTVLRTSVGTPKYLAPEQLLENRSSSEYTNAVDIWCLGHVLFEILTLQYVFEDYRQLNDYCEQRISFPRQTLVAGSVKGPVIELIMAMMARDPSFRPSASECVKTVQSLIPRVVSANKHSPVPEPRSKGSDHHSGQGLATSDQEAMQLLRQNGLEITTSNHMSKALMWAAENDHGIVIRLLLKMGTYVDTMDAEGRKALHHAARRGRTGIVRLLLDQGANIDSGDGEGRTALLYAAANGSVATVKLLLEAGAHVQSDTYSWTPLHAAATASTAHLAVVKLLLENGADVGIKDYRGYTALHIAACNGAGVLVKLFLEKGANIGVRDNEGWTVLHHAARFGEVAVVKLLLEKGADLNSSGEKYGLTPIDIAKRAEKEEVVSLLKDHGAKRSSTFNRLTSHFRPTPVLW